MVKPVSIIFKSKLERWGLRGDPYLWDELEKSFSTILLPCSKTCFIEHFEKTFLKLTNHSFYTDAKSIYVKKYAHGGMSSGAISMHFWRKEVLPLLLNRLEKENIGICN